jgi:hypothetical protein
MQNNDPGKKDKAAHKTKRRKIEGEKPEAEAKGKQQTPQKKIKNTKNKNSKNSAKLKE